MLKQMESVLSVVSDHVSVLAGKLEDLLFRAQRIAGVLKNDAKAPVSDQMFGYDLQNFRHGLREFGNELGGLPSALDNIERRGVFEAGSVQRAQAIMRLCERLRRSLEALRDQALLAHSHIRQAEHRVEAWSLTQEAETLVQSVQPLPGLANKILIKAGAAADRPKPEEPRP